MDQHNRKVFGYVIENDIQVNIIQNRVINISQLSRNNSSVVQMRKTMMRLFIYLLENAEGQIIQREDILLNVWDKYGLSSSSQRLWQVMQCLRKKLSQIGLSEDFITRVEKGPQRGYQIAGNKVRAIYYYE